MVFEWLLIWNFLFGNRSLGNQAFKMAPRKRKIQDEVEVDENKPKNTPGKKTNKVGCSVILLRHCMF